MFRMRAMPSLSISHRPIDRSVVWGIGLCIVLISLGIILSGRGLNFIDIPSFFIVLGGTVGAAVVQYGVSDVQAAARAMREALFERHYRPQERIRHLLDLSAEMKREGFMVLEREAESVPDPFLRHALELAVDGQPADEVRRILNMELNLRSDAAGRTTEILEAMGSYAPAMGLIGTLIGLIQMLGALDNPATIGPAMSVALVTTFYGALLANVVFLPLAGKLRLQTQQEALVKSITIEGAASLSRRESAVILEQRLQGFLPGRV